MVKNSGFGQLMEEAEDPGFYKILRTVDLSSEIIRLIPHHFIRSISDFSYKMVLKVAWGSTWQVKISKNPSFYYMEDLGWNKFVSDNCLGQNEYLTFTHEANMRFNVDIYEADGTEMLKPRKAATIASSSGQNKREQMKNKYVKKEEMESLSESSYRSPKTAESSGARLKQKRELNSGKKKAEEVEKSKKKMKKEKVETVCNDSGAGTSSPVPKCIITIRKSHLLYLPVPKKFVNAHMPRKSKTLKIHHPKGKKSWEVLYLVTDVQSRFSAGWSRFAKEFGLEVGDVCTLELIKPTEMVLKVSK